MKIGVFTDSHYSSAPLTCGKRYNNQSLRKIEEAMNAFSREQCDLVVILGDVTDTEPTRELEVENMGKIARVLEKSGMDVVCVMGNHDAFVFTPDEFYRMLGETYRPRMIQTEKSTLLFLDACYFHTGVHYAPGDKDWTDTFYPYVEELKHTLSEVKGEVYVFMHQNIDPEVREDHCLSNAAELRAALEEAGNVKAVYQGHYHWGHETTCNGIAYVTLSAMCENEGAYRMIQIP